jgi:hypothetical protein
LVAVSAVVGSQLCAALKFAYLLTTATNPGTQDPSQLKQPYEPGGIGLYATGHFAEFFTHLDFSA